MKRTLFALCALLAGCETNYVKHPVTGQKALDAYYKGLNGGWGGGLSAPIVQTEPVYQEPIVPSVPDNSQPTTGTVWVDGKPYGTTYLPSPNNPNVGTVWVNGVPHGVMTTP